MFLLGQSVRPCSRWNKAQLPGVSGGCNLLNQDIQGIVLPVFVWTELAYGSLWQSHLLKKVFEVFFSIVFGGEGGIRTLDDVATILVFETSRINHSRTSPETLYGMVKR